MRLFLFLFHSRFLLYTHSLVLFVCLFVLQICCMTSTECSLCWWHKNTTHSLEPDCKSLSWKLAPRNIWFGQYLGETESAALALADDSLWESSVFKTTQQLWNRTGRLRKWPFPLQYHFHCPKLSLFLPYPGICKIAHHCALCLAHSANQCDDYSLLTCLSKL